MNSPKAENIQKKTQTDPMARKNEKVAALLSIYWDRVARNPRGPAPCLVQRYSCEYIDKIAETYRRML
jgi:hypothetical protein